MAEILKRYACALGLTLAYFIGGAALILGLFTPFFIWGVWGLIPLGILGFSFCVWLIAEEL
jgi:hypothetical protein